MRMFKRFVIALSALLAFSAPTPAQTRQPVKWEVSAKKVKKNVYEVKAEGKIRAGWHIYDLQEYELGPNSTVFKVTGDAIEAVAPAKITSKVVRENDPTFGMEIGTCESPVVIIQRVKVLQDGPQEAKVYIEWQACNKGNCLPPADYETTLRVEGKDTVSSAGGESKGLWSLILEAILWGFLMLLTPCVFPMVPMTVSFFLKRSGSAAKGRFNAAMYGLFIVLLYTVPICVIIGLTWALGGETITADIFNWLATHWLPNIIFFVIFMVFAASFFGAFEITLPSSWTTKADSKSGQGGLLGIFFLALTLVLVSFSCTGPIVGTVLIKSTQGEFWTPMVTMLAFSIAFALPFALLALFPSVLTKLPKSGGWLNSVKVVLGFVEIALGLKFLSVADQTYHWHILDREVYLAIWIVVFTLLGLYLLGKIRFKHDSPLEYISVGRLALVIADFAFVVYMIPGMWGAPLKALSGYLPPIQTQDFVLGTYAPPVGVVEPKTVALPETSGVSLPHGLTGYDNLEDGIAAAAASQKGLCNCFTLCGRQNSAPGGQMGHNPGRKGSERRWKG